MKIQMKPRQFKNTKVDLKRNVIFDIIHIIYTLRRWVDEGNLFCILVTAQAGNTTLTDLPSQL